MSQEHSQLEGATEAFARANQDFLNASIRTIENMELDIIRRYPEFYSKEDRARAGVK